MTLVYTATKFTINAGSSTTKHCLIRPCHDKLG